MYRYEVVRTATAGSHELILIIINIRLPMVIFGIRKLFFSCKCLKGTKNCEVHISILNEVKIIRIAYSMGGSKACTLFLLRTMPSEVNG